MKTILSAFDRKFDIVDARNRELIGLLPESLLFLSPRGTLNSTSMFSCGEYIIRSAAMVEKNFAGIMTRLWDDPFEWTLPEYLSSREGILRYLDEVEGTRMRGFEFFTSDAELIQELPAPKEIRSLVSVLIETLAGAEHFQGRAFAVFQMLSDQRLPHV